MRAGFLDSLGVGLGIFPLGIALGVLVVQAGLPWWLAPALSIGVFAGSVELLLVSMLAAGLPLVDAVTAATATPARALGLWRRGRLVVGAAADLVALDNDLTVTRVMVAGAWR